MAAILSRGRRVKCVWYLIVRLRKDDSNDIIAPGISLTEVQFHFMSLYKYTAVLIKNVYVVASGIIPIFGNK